MNKYVLMRGYLLNNLEITPDKLCEKLIEDNKALAFISSNEIKSQNVSFSLIEEFIKDSNVLLKIDNLFIQEVCNSIIILLKPVTIYLENNICLDLNIFLRIYENNSMIVTIKINTDYSVESIFEKRIVKITGAKKGNLEFKDILSTFDIVSDLLYYYNVTLSPAISRNFFIINKKRMSLKNITKSLCQTSLKFKKYEPLKDFRGFDDYYHYTNELSSAVFGKNINDAYYRLLMLDHFIIYLILKDFRQYNNIKTQNYKLEELYKIKKDYDFSFVTKKYTKLTEDNDYVNYVLKTQNKYDLSKLCSYEIDRKIKQKNDNFQYALTFIGLFLAIPTVIEFIIDGYLNKVIEYIRSLI